MESRNVDEKESIIFTKELLEYLSEIDKGSVNKILTSEDEESRRDNVGWYQYIGGQHFININIPNILCYNSFIDQGLVDTNSYYAFLTLCVNHEFRHFMQGRCIWEARDIDGYGQKDVLNAQLMLYVRYFFDAYYLLNKGFVKYEEDAERFAIKNSIIFLKQKFPNMDVEKAIVDAVRLYADLQSRGGILSTLPCNCDTIEEITSKIDKRIEKNSRITPLDRTLFVYNPRYYGNHGYFGLDEDKLLTAKLISDYGKLSNGSKQDLLVAKAILSQLQKPEESLEEFPTIQKLYLQKKL